jgi:hypothetical protein
MQKPKQPEIFRKKCQCKYTMSLFEMAAAFMLAPYGIRISNPP